MEDYKQYRQEMKIRVEERKQKAIELMELIGG